MDFFIRLEQSGFAAWVREGGTLWSYPAILFTHTIGLATLAGVNAGIDLRLLGFGRRIPIAPLRSLFPVMWIAFAFTAASGTALLIADATTRLASPVFYVKMLLVLLAIVVLVAIRRLAFPDKAAVDQPLPPATKALAVASILLWVAATTAGRLMAYLGPVGGLG
jgi:hypothetical protein